MLFSVKMRAAQTQSYRHISGAERIVKENDLDVTVQAMLKRAQEHERGVPDFINIKVNKVQPESCTFAPVLNIYKTVRKKSVAQARKLAGKILEANGISKQAIQFAFAALLGLEDSMRGGILMFADSGKIIPLADPKRGVRVTNMDASQPQLYKKWLADYDLHSIHAREAIILASKVASCPQIVGELCWSDDPSYTIGYVASKSTYYRVENLKEVGSSIGGRVFFVTEDADPNTVINYLQQTVVLIEVPDAQK